MIKLHPEILRKDGKEQFVILPYEEFVAIQEALEDAEDLALLEEARREGGDEPNIPFDQIMQRFGLSAEEHTPE